MRPYNELKGYFMSLYYIEVHAGFKVEEFVEQFGNCKVTKDIEKALKFSSKKVANDFIKNHNGEGVNKDTAKIVEIF